MFSWFVQVILAEIDVLFYCVFGKPQVVHWLDRYTIYQEGFIYIFFSKKACRSSYCQLVGDLMPIEKHSMSSSGCAWMICLFSIFLSCAIFRRQTCMIFYIWWWRRKTDTLKVLCLHFLKPGGLCFNILQNSTLVDPILNIFVSSFLELQLLQ